VTLDYPFVFHPCSKGTIWLQFSIYKVYKECRRPLIWYIIYITLRHIMYQGLVWLKLGHTGTKSSSQRCRPCWLPVSRKIMCKIDVCLISSLWRKFALIDVLDNATDERRREFLAEIELMKKVGKHQNVLSFLGCWTTTKPLLLITEYVAHGDLRQWLIRKRSQVNN